MNKIEYEIILDENNRPIVGVSDENITKQENMFFIMEMARFYIENSLNNVTDQMTDEEYQLSSSVMRFFEDVTEELANSIVDFMELNGEIELSNNNKYVFTVKTHEELSHINKPIVYESKIYKLCPQLKALVLEDNNVYKYVNTVDNQSNWEKI